MSYRSQFMEQGFFTMSLCTRVTQQTCLIEAKKMAMAALEENPNARKKNIQKATNMINNARDIKALAFGIANFVLAHPSEDLKRK